MTSESTCNTTDDKLVPYYVDSGRPIMLPRKLAESLRDNDIAIGELVKKYLLQQECYDRQNQDIEEMNDKIRKINARDKHPTIGVYIGRGIDGVIEFIKVIFFFFKEMLLAAVIILKKIPSICANKWQESPPYIRNLGKLVGVCGLLIITGLFINNIV